MHTKMNEAVDDALRRSTVRVEHGWCQGVWARDEAGEHIALGDGQTIAELCIMGALRAEICRWQAEETTDPNHLRVYEHCLDRLIATGDLTLADDDREKLDGERRRIERKERTVACWQDDPRRTQAEVVALMHEASAVHALEIWLGPEITTHAAHAPHCWIDASGNELKSGAPVLIIDGAIAREPTSHVLSHALSLGQRRIEEGAIPIEDVPIVVHPAREHETEEWYKALPRIVGITCTGYDATRHQWATPNQICMAETPMDTIEIELELDIVPEAVQYIDALTLEVQAVVPNRTDTDATPTVAITTDHGWDLESLARFVEQSRPDWKNQARIVARRALGPPPEYTQGNEVQRLPRNVFTAASPRCVQRR